MTDINLIAPDFKTSNKVDIALFYADIGWPVFPCGPDEPGCDPKASILDAWQRRDSGTATTDPDLIRELWDKAPNANIGFCPDHAGLLIVDIDVKHDPSTLDRWEAHTMHEQGVPDTLAADTPSGGRHLYFAGHGRSSVGLIVPGLDIDTRGASGYVLLPGSTVDGVPYTWPEGFNPGRIAPAPEWILSALAVRHQNARIGELDKVAHVSRAREKLKQYVKAEDVAKSGQGGNDRTYRLFAEMTSFGLSAQKSFEIVAELWNPACLPPWDDEALMAFAANASRYSTGKNNLTVDMREAFADQLAATPAPAVAASSDPIERSRKAIDAYFDDGGMDNLKQPPWLIPDLIPQGVHGICFGRTGSFKSFVLLDLCLAIATGKSTCFDKMPTRSGLVVYAALEDRIGVMVPRRKAWKQAHGIAGEHVPNFMCCEAPLAQQNDVAQWASHVETLRNARSLAAPVLVVFETLSKMMDGADENGADDIKRALIAVEGICSIWPGCSAVVVHHETDAQDAQPGRGRPRGSSVITANVDFSLEIARPARTSTCEVYIRKMKNAPDQVKPYTLRMEAIGPSIVPRLSNAQEHAKATGRDDPLSPAAVQAALLRIGGRTGSGDAPEVDTHELASEIVGPIAIEDYPAGQQKRIMDGHDRLIVNLSKRLTQAARATGSPLQVYVSAKRGARNATLWSMSKVDPEPDYDTIPVVASFVSFVECI